MKKDANAMQLHRLKMIKINEIIYIINICQYYFNSK